MGADSVHETGLFFMGAESGADLFHGDEFCFMRVKSTEYQRHGAKRLRGSV